MRKSALLLFLAPFAEAAAAAPEWRQAREYEIIIRGNDIRPDPAHLEAGVPVRLRFINQNRERHALNALALLQSAQARKGDESLLKAGSIVVAPSGATEIVIVPAAGHYRIRSRNLFYRLLGMSSAVIVK